MKKLLLTLAIIFSLTVFAQSQQINFPEGNILVYSDTNNLAGGDVLIRSVYAFVPQKISDTTYEYQYKKAYWLNDQQVKNEFISKEFHKDSTIMIGEVEYTFEEIYNLIVAINESYWKIGSWQTFIQKIN